MKLLDQPLSRNHDLEIFMGNPPLLKPSRFRSPKASMKIVIGNGGGNKDDIGKMALNDDFKSKSPFKSAIKMAAMASIDDCLWRQWQMGTTL